MARLKLKHSKRPSFRGKGSRRGNGFQVRVKDKGGGLFLPDLEQQVRMIAMRGATDDEIADTFGVSRQAFQKWRKQYPSFESALEKGRLVADADVVVGLHKAATGYHYEEDQAVGGKTAGILRVERYARPDVEAAKYWLNNRQPEHWQNKSSLTGGRGKDGSDLPLGVKVETRNEIIESIIMLVQSKPDPKLEKPK